MILRHSTACTRALGLGPVSFLISARRLVLYATLALLMSPGRTLQRPAQRVAATVQAQQASKHASGQKTQPACAMSKKRKLPAGAKKAKEAKKTRKDDGAAEPKGKRRRQQQPAEAPDQPQAGRDRFKDRLQEGTLAYFAEVSDRLEALEDDEERGLLATRCFRLLDAFGVQRSAAATQLLTDDKVATWSMQCQGLQLQPANMCQCCSALQEAAKDAEQCCRDAACSRILERLCASASYEGVSELALVLAKDDIWLSVACKCVC